MVEHHLGRGGQATVWCVRHELMGTRRALKLLLDPNEATRQRLLREGRTQAKLEHPNLLPVTDVFETDHGLALLMPLVEGPTLQDVLYAKPIPALHAAALIRGIVAGVAAAHAAGIVHRDIKPANVLLDPASGVVVPRVTDFGLAKVLDGPVHTGTGTVFGTPGYSAPEQLMDSSRAARGADAWALGVLVYEILTGGRPFQTTDSQVMLQLAAEQKWIRPSAKGADPRWDDVLTGLLRPEPQERTDLHALLGAVEAIPGVLPPASWLPPAPARAERMDTSDLIPTERMRPPDGSYLPRGPRSPVRAPQMWDLSSEALGPSPLAKRIHVVAAFEDRAYVRHEVQKLRALGYSVPWEAPEDQPPVTLDSPSERRVLEAEEVWVFWSVAARRDPRVDAELRFAEYVADRRRERGKSTGRTYLVGRPLDDAPLPASLDTRPGSPSPAVFLSLVGVLAALGGAWQIGAQPWAWLALAAALVLCVAAALLQWMRRPDLMLRVGSLHRVGHALGRANVADLLALAEDLLDEIFGKRLVSLYSLRVSALISTTWAVPLIFTWIAYGVGSSLASGDDWAAALQQGGLYTGISFVTVLPTLIGNVLCAYLSLLVTRTALRRILRDPAPARLAIGLTLDTLVVALLAVGAAYTNGWGVYVTTKATGDELAWLKMVFSATWLFVSGGLSWNVAGDVHLTNALASFCSMLTATLPSLVHASMLVVALGNRILGRWPLEMVGEVLRRMADTPRGPWSLVAPVVAVGGALTLLSRPTLDRYPPPQDLVAGHFAAIAPACDPCAIGCAASEPGCAASERWREVPAPAPFALLDTEVWQALWVSVWDQAGPIVADRYGLPRNPAVYAGADLPVDSVSWCNGLRFANLWTAVDAKRTGRDLRPVYGAVNGGGPDLASCEAVGAVLRADGNGYRIPTEAEWELAARGGTKTAYWTGDSVQSVLAADWLAWNGGWRTHPVRSAPDPAAAAKHPYGLHGVHGNIAEWTWDVASPTAKPTERVFHGASVYGHPRDARSASRLWYRPTDRFLLRGIRLVAPE